MLRSPGSRSTRVARRERAADGWNHPGLLRDPRAASGGSRSAIILACASKPYFAGLLRKSGASPLLWTTNLMAPEAYTLKAAVDGWLLGETGEAIRRRAAEAYNQHQSCGMNAALKLFSTGW